MSGAPPLALLLWSRVEGTASLFQHGNIGLPGKFDGFLRLFR